MKKLLISVLVLGSVTLLAEPPPLSPPPAAEVRDEPISPASDRNPSPSAPGGGIPAAFAQAANFPGLRAEAIEAALAAARAPDEKSRVMAWKRVEEVDRRFVKMLNSDFRGAKLAKDDRQAVQLMFYTEFVGGLKEAGAQVNDPTVKAFFDKKRANYEHKLEGLSPKKPVAKKKAPPKKNHEVKKHHDPKKDKDARKKPEPRQKDHPKKDKKKK